MVSSLTEIQVLFLILEPTQKDSRYYQSNGVESILAS